MSKKRLRKRVSNKKKQKQHALSIERDKYIGTDVESIDSKTSDIENKYSDVTSIWSESDPNSSECIELKKYKGSCDATYYLKDIKDLYTENGLKEWKKHFQNKYKEFENKNKYEIETLEVIYEFIKEISEYFLDEKKCVKQRIEYKYNCILKENRDIGHNKAINYSEFYADLSIKLIIEVYKLYDEVETNIEERRKKEEEMIKEINKINRDIVIKYSTK